MFFWSKKEVEDDRQEIRDNLKFICDNVKLERDNLISNFNDTLSLVCAVNQDISYDKKVLFVSECIADYFFFMGQKQIAQEWYERQKTIAKKDKIICFEIPAEDMSVLYGDHMKSQKTTGQSPFHNVTALTFLGKVYPMAFCLGFQWTSKLKTYMKYNSFSL